MDGLSFRVKKGEVHGFLGPNGAGKTTAIKIILGLIPSNSGEIKVFGQKLVFGQKIPCLEKLSYLPQEPVFPEGLTGKEVLEFVSTIYAVEPKVREARVERLLSYFQLSDAAKRKVGAYSRGMKQRLGLASVLISEPDLLILDEPVSALDPEGRRQVLGILQKLKGRATVFLSSHILADVEEICDRLTIINRGCKILDAKTEDLLERYTVEQYVLKVKEEQTNKAAATIKANPLVNSVLKSGSSLIITTEPGKTAEAVENILPELIKSGITVIEFARSRGNLEDAFFKVLSESREGYK